jgi:glycosyltransferase involved in cell wall biosynthesis
LGGPAWTEAATIASETARALAAQGAEVHVFTGRGPGQSAETRTDGVHYHRCAHDPDPDPAEEADNFARAVLALLRKREQSSGFEVVHGFEWPATLALGELRREGACGTVWSFLHPHQDWRPPLWLLAETEVAPRWGFSPDDFAEVIIAPYDAAKEAFLTRWGLPCESVQVVHPGVDPGWPGPADDAAEVKGGYHIGVFDPTLLFMGHLTRQSRADLLLDAMPLVLERHPQAKLVCAAGGEMEEFLADRACVLGLEQAVRLVGELPEPELARLCASCDLVCLPQRSRSLLSPLLQAWSAGKPVVTTRACSASVHVWHEVTGYLCEESAPGLAAGVLWMFSDFDRCRWVGGNGRRAVEEVFGWPAIGARLMQLYRRVAAPPPLTPASA